MIIDFHVHAFPDKIAARAVDKLSREGGGLEPLYGGSADEMRTILDKEDAMGVLLPVATNPEKLRSINEWAIAQNRGNIIAFGAAHPFAPDAVEQLEYVKSAGLKGVKLHPEYQGYDVDAEEAVNLYRHISRLGLIAVFHSGLDVGFMPPERCHPKRLAKVLGAFDGSCVVAAHLGGYMRWEETLDCLCGENVYLDTAYCHGRIIKPLALKIIEKHGADKVLFASDMPWSGIAQAKRFVDSLGLDDSEKKQIMGLNALRLLNIDSRGL